MQSVSKTITTDQFYYRVVTKMTKAAVTIDLFVNILTSLPLGFSCGLFIFGIGSWPLLQIGMSFKIQNQGPVVQSVVSLTSSLRVISLTILADSIYNILILFAEKM